MQLKVGFVCTGNSCRSQMAEGFAKYYGSDVFEVFSAGTHPAPKVNEKAVKVMEEAGVDISNQYTKTLKEIPAKLDILIKMGCGAECPFIKSRHIEDWKLPDPAGKPVNEFIKVRDIIKNKVIVMINRIKNNSLKLE